MSTGYFFVPCEKNKQKTIVRISDDAVIKYLFMDTRLGIHGIADVLFLIKIGTTATTKPEIKNISELILAPNQETPFIKHKSSKKNAISNNVVDNFFMSMLSWLNFCGLIV
jgi:hypothetical protein